MFNFVCHGVFKYIFKYKRNKFTLFMVCKEAEKFIHIFLASSPAAAPPHRFVLLTLLTSAHDNFFTVCTVRYAVCILTHLNASCFFFPHKNHSKLQDDSSNLPSRLLLTEFRSLVVSHPRQNSRLPGNTSYGGKKNFKMFKKVSVFFKWSQDGTI